MKRMTLVVAVILLISTVGLALAECNHLWSFYTASEEVYYKKVNEKKHRRYDKTTYTCDTCGETKSETIESFPENHRFGGWEVTKTATCKKTGQRQKVCKDCDYVFKETLDKIPHKYNLIYFRNATCTATGLRKYRCSACQDIKTEKISKKPHTLRTYRRAINANFAYEITECTVCGTEISCKKVSLSSGSGVGATVLVQ